MSGLKKITHGSEYILPQFLEGVSGSMVVNGGLGGTVIGLNICMTLNRAKHSLELLKKMSFGTLGGSAGG